MDRDVFIKELQKNIDMRRNEIIGLGEEIYKNPETGFKEYKTTKLAAEYFESLGFKCIGFDNITGFKATLDTGREGPSIAILGELDAVICPEHPDCNKDTGAVHACGHNAQIAAIYGAAAGILDSHVIGNLSGKLHFIAVPAEEYIEIEYRMDLKQKGIINYLGGKPELLFRGFLDDIDMCIMIHSAGGIKKFSSVQSFNGCIVKKIKYVGKAAHAGGSPHEGINALYAANLGLMAINSIRETFKEEDFIRVHPIITKGGDIVNVIPCEVLIETLVRGKSMDGILCANKKVNRALAGGAVAIGGKVEIEDLPGYFPLLCDRNLTSIAGKIMKELVKDDEISDFGHLTASTDLGDLSMLMPVIHPFTGGVEGGLHSAQFRVTDHEAAYLLPAKFLACTAMQLLWADAIEAKNVMKGFTPFFKSKSEYFKYADKLFSSKVYNGLDFTG